MVVAEMPVWAFAAETRESRRRRTVRSGARVLRGGWVRLCEPMERVVLI